MSGLSPVSNEAEFERWLVAALQWERERLLGALQAQDESGRSPAEPYRDAEDCAIRPSTLSC